MLFVDLVTGIFSRWRFLCLSYPKSHKKNQRAGSISNSVEIPFRSIIYSSSYNRQQQTIYTQNLVSIFSAAASMFPLVPYDRTSLKPSLPVGVPPLLNVAIPDISQYSCIQTSTSPDTETSFRG